jgi:hypothetical protein
MAQEIACKEAGCTGTIPYQREPVPGLASISTGTKKRVYLTCPKCGKTNAYEIDSGETASGRSTGPAATGGGGGHAGPP